MKEQDSFYPFAMIMDKKRDISIISTNIDNEYPDAEYLVNLYEKEINKKFAEEEEFILAVICIDIFINEEIEGTQKKNDAVEFRLISPNAVSRLYKRYVIGNNYIVWQ